jgi:hypothetical protein
MTTSTNATQGFTPPPPLVAGFLLEDEDELAFFSELLIEAAEALDLSAAGDDLLVASASGDATEEVVFASSAPFFVFLLELRCLSEPCSPLSLIFNGPFNLLFFLFDFPCLK